jgi:Heme NO binding associated
VIVCDDRKADIVDNVLRKLEKHAENLEQMVNRRTAELEGEKLKTDLLLYRMLPRSVEGE